MTQALVFRNLQLLDPRFGETRGGYEVLTEGGVIKEVSERPITASSAQRIDCGGRTLMPGLIDCHVHVYLSEVNVSLLEHVPVSLLAARAAPLMLGMLNRFHDGTRYGRRRLGNQRGGRERLPCRAAIVHLRPRHRSHRWALGHAATDRPPSRLPLLPRTGIHDGNRGWRGQRTCCRSRGAAAGR